MRASSCWMRDCVCSTVPLSVSTFELTVPTSVRTNFLVAQAGAMATVRDSRDAATRLLGMFDFLLNDQFNAPRPCIRLAHVRQGSSFAFESRAGASQAPVPARR